MSRPVITQQTTFQTDCTSKQSLKSSESFNFSAGSTDAAGFNYSKGSEKSHLSSRSRPRLVKMRKKQMLASQDGKTVNGLNGNIDVTGKKEVDGELGGNNGNSGLNGSTKIGDLNVNTEQLGNGSHFGASLNDSLFGLGSGKGKSLCGSSMNSSTSTSQSKDGNFSFVFNTDSSKFNVQKETGSFVFGARESDNCGVKLDEQGLNNSGLRFDGDDFGKFSSGGFVFGASKNASSMSNSDQQQHEFGESTIRNVRGKVKLDASRDSEKVCNPNFQFPVNWSNSISKNHVNFVFASDNCDSKFGVDLENKPTCKSSDMPDSGKENTETGFQSQSTRLDGVFVFGGLKGKEGFNSGVSTEPVNGMNAEKVEDCNGFGQLNHNSSSDKYRNGGDSFEKGPAFSILNEMKRLNIGDAKKSGSFTSNSAANANDVFVFGGEQKKSSFMKENVPNMSQKTSDGSHFSQNNSESNELNGGSREVPSMNKDEKDSISFGGNVGGLGSDTDYSIPNIKFALSYNDLFPGMDKPDNTNSRSLGGKRSKKGNGKLRQKPVAQKLFSQNHVSKEGSFQQNHESPGFGSPMDFSPYQDTSASNAPKAETGIGVKGEFSTNEKHILENCEMPRDDKSNSNLSPSLPAQDGLSELRCRYKKKYKLRVGLSPTGKRINLGKENAKQEPKGTAPHEVCEHWRIRGNEAYHAGKLSKAEEFYTIGINSVPALSTIGYAMKPLLLCYSNRAATRMSLGRMREAIGDCKKASELDSNFLKVTLRAGNCYLVLGEVEDAIQCYTKCLSAGASICLDRKITIEAADGLQKAKKVAEYMHQSIKLLREGTDDAAGSAIGNIEEALSISRYSERLLQRKGEALCILRKYDEVIQLCEQALDIAERNFGADRLDNPGSHVKLWRWHLQAKSHYHMGRLELALDLIEKQERIPFSKFGDITQESSIALAANIRELLSLKRSGNEAFNAGRYTEAVENYTAAISKSFESRAFMAICFCNRAAAYQSLSQIVDAISDCSVAIALDENYPKAISRRATLHEMIRDYKQAVCDLQRLVSLLESQSQIKTQSRSSGGSAKDLRKARRRLSLIEEKTKKELPLDLYLILGIKASDAESEIKKAYRKAALRHHPDKAAQVLVRSDVGDDGALWKEFGEKIHKDADRLFKIIGEAYAVLSEPSKRSKYDDEEEMRNIYRDSNRNSNAECASTSYSSPYERGSWSGRPGGFSASFERNGSRRSWYEAKSYSYSHSRW